MEEDVLHSTLSVLPCQDIPNVLVAPGQCNKAPRRRQRDAGACSVIRQDGVSPRAQRYFDIRQESTRVHEHEGQI